MTKVSDEILVLAGTSATWDEGAIFNADFVMSSVLLGVPCFTGDIAGLPQDVRDLYAKYISFYKENRKFFVNSHVYQLNFRYLPMTDYENYLAFQMQDADQDKSLVFVYTSSLTRREERRFKLFNLDPEKNYTVKQIFGKEDNEVVMTGKELMKYGINSSFSPSLFIRHRAAIYQIESH